VLVVVLVVVVDSLDFSPTDIRRRDDDDDDSRT